VEAPSTDSLVALVEQALQAGDDGLLEQCLECPDRDVVSETSKRLPTRLVVPLLRKLVAKFEKKPARGVLLTRWIHTLLRCHMSFLLAVPDLAQQLAALSQMLEQRLATYSRLAALAGRLDLLISQISSSPSSSSSSAPSSSSSSTQRQQESVKLPNQIYYED
jgi:U3 small nucleolar RNA-associated protein 5